MYTFVSKIQEIAFLSGVGSWEWGEGGGGETPDSQAHTSPTQLSIHSDCHADVWYHKIHYTVLNSCY